MSTSSIWYLIFIHGGETWSGNKWIDNQSEVGRIIGDYLAYVDENKDGLQRISAINLTNTWRCHGACTRRDGERFMKERGWYWTTSYSPRTAISKCAKYDTPFANLPIFRDRCKNLKYFKGLSALVSDIYSLCFVPHSGDETKLSVQGRNIEGKVGFCSV